jgi:hypothetical protein
MRAAPPAPPKNPWVARAVVGAVLLAVIAMATAWLSRG